MTLSIVALFIFIFGAYAYGYLLVLWMRARTPLLVRPGAGPALQAHAARANLALFVACALWFVLHAIIEFRWLMGEPRQDDLLDLATLELVFLFPGLIFHTYLLEARSDEQPMDRAGAWKAAMWLFYVLGIGLAVYFAAVILRALPSPGEIGPYITLSIGTLFTAMSISCVVLMDTSPRPSSTHEQTGRHRAIRLLFVAMIGIVVGLNVMRGPSVLVESLNLVARSTPLAFLLVSVYFENRIQFYDLVVKRGVLLIVSLLLTGAVLALTIGSIEDMPPGAARPWLLAVLLLPVAVIMPWLHDRLSRALDRWWFGRHFTQVDAIKQVLGAMQQATDERSLVEAAEHTLSEMFRRRLVILLEHDAVPDDAVVVTEIRTPSGQATVRLALRDHHDAGVILSEDLALLRSLVGVFGYLLENTRLQRRRHEQEQLAQDLRLQSSRSELKALRAQINPHFLFNALNAIAALIHTDPARADAAVEQLAEVFRYTLRRSDQEWAPLEQELAFVRAYLDVEQARFGRRLDYTIDLDPRLGGTQIPSMLLQTLVENAVKHGIARLRTPGHIRIVATREGGRVCLEVRDTGPGPENGTPQQRPPSGEGFGLRSVRDRLAGHFGTEASFALVREDEATVARVVMPVFVERAVVSGAGR